MKLRNKETDEIDDFILEVINDRIDLYRRAGNSDIRNIWHYNSLAELNEEWEDYEGPKKYYVINPVDWAEGIGEIEYRNDSTDKINKQIGNYFETKEEAEKAVGKLKAWKRLKDLGTEILGWEIRDMPTGGNWQTVNVKLNVKDRKEPMSLLDLLFGGEE